MAAWPCLGPFHLKSFIVIIINVSRAMCLLLCQYLVFLVLNIQNTKILKGFLNWLTELTL